MKEVGNIVSPKTYKKQTPIVLINHAIGIPPGDHLAGYGCSRKISQISAWNRYLKRTILIVENFIRCLACKYI